MKKMLALIAVLSLAVPAGLAWADDEEGAEEEDAASADDSSKKSTGGDSDCTEPDGAHDHPAISRFPKSCMNDFQERDFEAYEFPLGAGDQGKTQTVEGHYFLAGYKMPENIGCTQVLRNYENAFKAAHLKINKGKGLPEASQSATGGLSVGWYTDRWMTGIGKTKAGAPYYVLQTCVEWNSNETYGLTLVVETKNMEQLVEVASADFMAEQIAKTGRVALYGITFATGKSDITPDSAKELEQIGNLLAQKPDWKLRVEGHTDNVGNAKANLELSKKRAAAVKDWLVKKHGVSAARLLTEGYGDTKPVADNGSDDGRAKNRRVELAKL